MYKPPLGMHDIFMEQLQREDYLLPLWMRVIPIKVEEPVLPPDTRRRQAPPLPRTAIVRNAFLGAVEGITQEFINLATKV